MPRRYPTISHKDGWYHAWVTVGTKPNGRPDQRHVKRRTVPEVEERIDELLAQKREAAVQKPGKAPTVRGWLLDTYLATIAPRRIDPTTVQGYRRKILLYVVPVIGHLRMDRVDADNIDAVYLAMQRKGLADTSILQVHRILSRAWRVATKRRVAPRNIFRDDVDPPTVRRKEMTPLALEDAVRVLAAAAGRRNAARWSVALALGLRQGEALGLRWQYVDLAAGEIRVWWQLHRREFEHGCAGEPCGRKRAGNCPARALPLESGEVLVKGGLILKAPKGKSKRTIPIPPEIVAALKAHREVQALEKQFADGAYTDRDFVFAGQLGDPIDPSPDYDEWLAVLKAAGVARARVHDARHTAATLLLAQGVAESVVQELLGHAKITTTRGYVHVASKMARDATDRMGRALLRPPATP